MGGLKANHKSTVVGHLGLGGLDSNRNNLGGSGLVVPTPQFRVLSDGSITPTIGTAGTFARASTVLIGNPTKNALLSKASGEAAAEARPTGAISPTTNRGGVFIHGAVTNYILQASDFSTTWTALGGGSVTTDSTTDPLGGSTADTITGASAPDGITQTSGSAAASVYWAASVWLKADSGTRTVHLRVKDEGTEYTQTACTVTTNWQQFTANKLFTAGAAGNAGISIYVHSTAGYNIYAYGAGLYNTSDSTTAGWHYPSTDFTPTIITTAAPVSLAASFLKYTGAELTTSTNKRSLVMWWYMPQDSFPYANKYLFSEEGAGFAKYQGAAYQAATATVCVAYYDGTLVDTGDAPVYNRWNQLIVASDGAAGDNETYLNGVSIHTDANAAAATAIQTLTIGSEWSDASSPQTRTNSIIGRVEYHNKRVSSTEAANMYAAQKGDYGL